MEQYYSLTFDERDGLCLNSKVDRLPMDTSSRTPPSGIFLRLYGLISNIHILLFRDVGGPACRCPADDGWRKPNLTSQVYLMKKGVR